MLLLAVAIAKLREAEMEGARDRLVGTPTRIRVKGPLARYTDDFRVAMTAQGFSRSIVTNHTNLLAHLSSWMRWHGLAANDLNADRLDAFLTARRASGRRKLVSRRGLAPLLGYLRACGAVPQSEWRVPSGPARELLEQYCVYLRLERGYAPLSVKSFASKASCFLSRLPFTDVDGLASLSTADVTRLLVDEVGRTGVWAAKSMVTALRVFLRYLHTAGYIAKPLTAAVPQVAGWALSALPRAIPAGQVTAVMDSCNRATARGRRDYAILLMLWRLGLRNGEVVLVELDDIDWQSGSITVRGKGSRTDVLPLPVDVGQAVTAYLLDGRPTQAKCRRLFLIDRAPYTGLARSSLVSVVYAACRRAGLEPFSPHAFRHSVASALLAQGASLVEVGQLLRHRAESTTAIYAKLDRRALGELVRPWPQQSSGGCGE